jgi:hypothetical protein
MYLKMLMSREESWLESGDWRRRVYVGVGS